MSSQVSSPKPCSQPLLFSDLDSRKVVADFSGGHLSSDGGLLLLRELDSSLGLTRSLAACFRDAREPLFVEHSLCELLAQRVLGPGRRLRGLLRVTLWEETEITLRAEMVTGSA